MNRTKPENTHRRARPHAAAFPLLLTLGIWGRLLAVLPGLLACAAALYLRAPAWSVLPAALLFLVPLMRSGTRSALALLVAPVLIGIGLEVRGFTHLDALVPLVLVLAATLPFFLHLGGDYPARFLPLYLGVPALVLILLVTLAPEAVRLILQTSDLQARLQVAVVFLAVLVVDLLLRLRRPTNTR